MGERGVFPSKISISSNWNFLGTSLSTNSVEFVNQQTVQVLTKINNIDFLLVPRKNPLSRILCCGRERTFSLQEQYPNWIFYFAPLIKYLNRASSPSYGFWIQNPRPLAHIKKYPTRVIFNVGERGLEPPLLTEPVPKTGAATITPLAQLVILYTIIR